MKVTDFHPACIAVHPEAHKPSDPTDEGPAQQTDVTEPVGAKAGIGNNRDRFFRRNSRMEAVEEGALYPAVLGEFSRNDFAHQRK